MTRRASRRIAGLGSAERHIADSDIGRGSGNSPAQGFRREKDWQIIARIWPSIRFYDGVRGKMKKVAVRPDQKGGKPPVGFREIIGTSEKRIRPDYSAGEAASTGKQGHTEERVRHLNCDRNKRRCQ